MNYFPKVNVLIHSLDEIAPSIHELINSPVGDADMVQTSIPERIDNIYELYHWWIKSKYYLSGMSGFESRSSSNFYVFINNIRMFDIELSELAKTDVNQPASCRLNVADFARLESILQLRILNIDDDVADVLDI